MEGLFAYLEDTKIATIDVVTKGKVVGKAYLNFLVMKGWRGESIEGHLDIKQSKRKIGEVNYCMEILQTDNPFLVLDREP